jgi:ABC-type antimicrobial peptide transport system permease subunit
MRRVLFHLLLGLVVGAVLAAVSPFATGNAVGWGAAVFVFVAAGSTWRPVLRATRLDPATVLRWE